VRWAWVPFALVLAVGLILFIGLPPRGTGATGRVEGVSDVDGATVASGSATPSVSSGLYPRAASPSPGPPVAPALADPSGQTVPVGDLPGWRQVFTDDFAVPVPLGRFPAAVSQRWSAYTGFRNFGRTGTGTYDPTKTVSIAGGLMNIHLHTENGVHYIAAPLPILPGHRSAYSGQTYGRYAVRFRAEPVAGYKIAWLLWPDSDRWSDGEVDFPEGALDYRINANMHHRGDPTTVEGYQTGVDTYGGWHTAVIEWTPAHIAFYLDGVLKGDDTRADVLPDTGMHWVLQTETRENVNPADSASGDVQLDWVSIWSRA
jgi:hypothetical protein